MKKAFIYAILMLLSIETMGQTDAPAYQFDQANQLYLQGDYAKARDGYVSIIQNGLESTELYYNLGNAFYKLGDLPSAILNYEKAIKLSPGNKEARQNLEMANLMITDRIENLPTFFMTRWIRSLIAAVPVNTWTVIGLISFAFFLAALSGVVLLRRSLKRNWLVLGAFLIMLITAGSLSFAYAGFQRMTQAGHAILFDEAVKVKSTPDESGIDLFIIHEGTKVKLGKKIGEWTEIELANGNRGWIQAGSYREI